MDIVREPLPENDPKQRRPDITRAKEVLGWQPKISRQEGLKRTYAYFKGLSHEDYTAANTRISNRTPTDDV